MRIARPAPDPRAESRDSPPVRRRANLARALLYVLPLALWGGVLLAYGAGERGRYEVSWALLQKGLGVLAPEWSPISDGSIVSMYQLNAAFRRLAHVAAYAVLTLLIIRLIQHGNTRLRSASLAAAALIGAVFMASDEWVRRHQAHRHAKPVDLVLDGIGVALVMGGTWVFFAVKEWERRVARVDEDGAGTRVDEAAGEAVEPVEALGADGT